MADKKFFRPPFGMATRALRLGYRWSEDHGCYVRISVSLTHGWRIDLALHNYVPTSKSELVEHVCWWDDPGCLLACKPLERIRAAADVVSGPLTIYVNDDGEEVKRVEPQRH